MDLRALSGVADFFAIATATSHRQVLAITEHIDAQLLRSGQRVWHVEGLTPSSARGSTRAVEADPEAGDGLSWVLMDGGDFVMHLFNPPARRFYQLEHLWGDAPRIPIESRTL